MKSFLKRSILACATLGLVFASGCSLDLPNPNQPSDLEVLSTRDGLFALSVGMQQLYANAGMETILMVPGTSAREVTPDFDQVPLRELEEGGGALPNTTQWVVDFWTRMYRVITMCDQIIANVPSAIPAGGTRSGVLALAYTYKAMCLGTLAQSFEQAALSSGTRSNPASFVPRAQVYAEALRLLAQANDQISQTPVSAEFASKVVAPGFNLANTIRLYRARYALFAGQNQDAITFANAVDTTAAGRSDFRYDNGLNPNPVFNVAVTQIRWIARRNFGLPTDLVDTTDARIAFFTTPRASVSILAGLPVATFAPGGYFGAITSTIPAFRPGEAALIRAEANARAGRLAEAITDINRIRTKATDYLGLGAKLPAYSGPQTADAVLTEIYRQRCAELYLSGLRFEDARRFGRSAPTTAALPRGSAALLQIERTRNFYPYPQSERDNNPNTPADPAI
jgi:hypothetical protein